MEYQEAIDWLYDTQGHGIKLGLDNTLRLLEALGHPERIPLFLHVAGTNGKGSTCAFSASILRAHGLRTGLFTSPHLVDFRERITMDGDKISEAEVAAILTHLRGIGERMPQPPTFFEFVFALAAAWFAEQQAEVVVLETGMGGRLDATNTVQPGACAITPIGLDHQKWLGNSIEEIAAEKAGIIKPGVPVVFAPQDPAALDVLVRTAVDVGAPWKLVDKAYEKTVLPLRGSHQKWNAAVAMEACEQLLGGSWKRHLAAHGLRNTEWPCRFQALVDESGTRYILDGAHNPHAAENLVATWREEFGNRKAIVIFGSLNDKHPASMIEALGAIAENFVFVPVRSPRSVNPADFHAPGIPSQNTDSLDHALQLVRGTGFPVVVTGSLFLAGEALAILRGTTPAPPSNQ